MKRNRIARIAFVTGAAIAMMAVSASIASAGTTAKTVKADPGAYAAKLYGSVTSTEWVRYGFQYGTTTEYGQESSASYHDFSNSPGSLTYIAKIEGLQPNTTYHYQFGAMKKNGEIVFGEDKTFTTTGPTQFKADQYPATVNATQEVSRELAFGFEGEPLTCSTATGLGSMNSASSTLSLTPNLTGCEAINPYAAEVAGNGCSVTFLAGDAGYKNSSMGISCPEGRSIEINAGTCGISIPSQSGLGVVQALSRGTTPASLLLELDVTGLRYVKTRDGYLCKLNGTGTKEDGTVTGKLIVTATNSLSVPIGFQIG